MKKDPNALGHRKIHPVLCLGMGVGIPQAPVPDTVDTASVPVARWVPIEGQAVPPGPQDAIVHRLQQHRRRRDEGVPDVHPSAAAQPLVHWAGGRQADRTKNGALGFVMTQHTGHNAPRGLLGHRYHGMPSDASIWRRGPGHAPPQGPASALVPRPLIAPKKRAGNSWR